MYAIPVRIELYGTFTPVNTIPSPHKGYTKKNASRHKVIVFMLQFDISPGSVRGGTGLWVSTSSTVTGGEGGAGGLTGGEGSRGFTSATGSSSKSSSLIASFKICG